MLSTWGICCKPSAELLRIWQYGLIGRACLFDAASCSVAMDAEALRAAALCSVLSKNWLISPAEPELAAGESLATLGREAADADSTRTVSNPATQKII